jgi:hypothetical protein
MTTTKLPGRPWQVALAAMLAATSLVGQTPAPGASPGCGRRRARPTHSLRIEPA